MTSLLQGKHRRRHSEDSPRQRGHGGFGIFDVLGQERKTIYNQPEECVEETVRKGD